MLLTTKKEIMKYKIGNVEVEAVQWNGENEFKKISGFLDDIKFGLYGISRDKKDNITIEDGDFEKVAFLKVGQYLVKSKTSLSTLSEQDFNNMATPVKDPKFKVGDKVYYIEMFDSKFDCDIVRVKFVDFDPSEEEFIYDFTHDHYKSAGEKELFTLEEAMQKLKEL